MKKKLKKMNRGLILGAILIIIVVIYVIVDYARFSSEKTIIKSNLEEYLEKFVNASIMEDLNYSKESDNYKNLSNIINTYWCDKKITNQNWNFTYPRMLQELNNRFSTSSTSKDNEYMDWSNGYIFETSYNIKNMTIKKAGPNLAKVTGTIIYDISSSDIGSFIFPFSDGYIDYYDYNYDGKQQSISKDKYIASKVENQFEVYMYREDGNWKIAESNGFAHSQNSVLKDREVK